MDDPLSLRPLNDKANNIRALPVLDGVRWSAGFIRTWISTLSNSQPLQTQALPPQPSSVNEGVPALARPALARAAARAVFCRSFLQSLLAVHQRVSPSLENGVIVTQVNKYGRQIPRINDAMYAYYSHFSLSPLPDISFRSALESLEAVHPRGGALKFSELATQAASNAEDDLILVTEEIYTTESDHHSYDEQSRHNFIMQSVNTSDVAELQSQGVLNLVAEHWKSFNVADITYYDYYLAFDEQPYTTFLNFVARLHVITSPSYVSVAADGRLFVADSLAIVYSPNDSLVDAPARDRVKSLLEFTETQLELDKELEPVTVHGPGNTKVATYLATPAQLRRVMLALERECRRRTNPSLEYSWAIRTRNYVLFTFPAVCKVSIKLAIELCKASKLPPAATTPMENSASTFDGDSNFTIKLSDGSRTSLVLPAKYVMSSDRILERSKEVLNDPDEELEYTKLNSLAEQAKTRKELEEYTRNAIAKQESEFNESRKTLENYRTKADDEKKAEMSMQQVEAMKKEIEERDAELAIAEAKAKKEPVPPALPPPRNLADIEDGGNNGPDDAWQWGNSHESASPAYSPISRFDERPVKGILRAPREKFPDDPMPVREGVAPLPPGVPPEAKWTKINRILVSPEVLKTGKEHFEVRGDSVIVLRILSRDEVQEYADATAKLRAKSEEEGQKRRRDETVPMFLSASISGLTLGLANPGTEVVIPERKSRSPPVDLVALIKATEKSNAEERSGNSDEGGSDVTSNPSSVQGPCSSIEVASRYGDSASGEPLQGEAARKAAWSLAGRSKYQFEADSDDDTENEIDSNLEALGHAAGRLKALARATGQEVDEQNSHISRIVEKTDRVDDQVVMNRARLDRIDSKPLRPVVHGQNTQLTAEDEEEDDEGLAQTVQRIRHMKQEDISSTRNALRTAAQEEEISRATLARLGAQGERLHNTERNLDLATNRAAKEKAKMLKRVGKSVSTDDSWDISAPAPEGDLDRPTVSFIPADSRPSAGWDRVFDPDSSASSAARKASDGVGLLDRDSFLPSSKRQTPGQFMDIDAEVDDENGEWNLGPPPLLDMDHIQGIGEDGEERGVMSAEEAKRLMGLFLSGFSADDEVLDLDVLGDKDEKEHKNVEASMDNETERGMGKERNEAPPPQGERVE